MEIDKLFENNSIDSVADNVFGVVNNSVSEVREMQRKKVAENVQLVVNALKKIEQDIKDQYDSVSNNLEKRIISIKDGRDGIDGRDGKDGKDGKQGKDGRPGRDGKDGKNGLNGESGEDGVSVVNAHIDFDGSLIISLSSGKEINVGEVVAPALAEQIKVITNGGGTSQSVLDTLTSLQSQIDALSGATIYKGLWNASTNSPALTSSVGTSGNFYIVSVAGSTSLNGITNWGVGDWAIFNGSVWQRVEGGAAGNFTTVTASSLTSGRVTYAGTAGLLQDSSNLTFNGTTLTSTGFSGPLNGTVGATTPAAGAFTALSGTGLSIANSAASILRATINASNVTAQQVDIAFTNSGGSTYIGQDAAGNSFIDARGALNAITLGYSGAVVTTIGTTGLTMASGMSIRGTNNLTLNATTGNSVIAQVNNATVGTFSSTGLAVTGYGSFTNAAIVTAASGEQSYLIGNQDGAGAAGPNFVSAANGTLYFGRGTSFAGTGGTHSYFGSWSTTGLAVTGTISQTANQLQIGAGTVAEKNIRFWNGAGYSYVGVESSAGGVIATGSAPYSAVLAAAATQSVQIAPNTTVMATFSPTGLAVTGALSATVADAAISSRLIATTGRIRIRPYVDATLGAVFESTDTPETAYLPLSLFGSVVKIGSGANVSISPSGLTVTPGIITTGSTTALRLATSGGTQFSVENAASSVNYINVQGSAAGGSPNLYPIGSDADIGLNLFTKGSDPFSFYTNVAAAAEQVRINHTASANRYITLTGSNGGNPTIGTSAGRLAITPDVQVSGGGVYLGSTIDSVQGQSFDTIAGNTVTATNKHLNGGLVICRNRTDGGTGVFILDETSGSTLISQTATNMSATDSGASTNKICVLYNGGVLSVYNRYASAKNVEVVFAGQTT
jgi:hypothetical protein